MKLYQQFAEKGYHTSVVTTFGIDFDTYETVVLPRLRGAGCRNNLVVADGRMLTHALDGPGALPQRAGSQYTVSGAGGGGGVFHPKLFLQLGRDKGRLMVGSANMTAAGIAGNLELIATFRSGGADPERGLLVQAWRFIEAFLSPEQAHQAQWMLVRTPWVRDTEAADGPIRLPDGSEAALLLSNDGEGIGRRFARLAGAEVNRIVVVSPYWDDSLQALFDLSRQLEPARIGVLIDPSTEAFPADVAARRLPDLEVFARRTFGGTRYMHAKAIVAMARDADHLLVGSANCTTAALGKRGSAGTNAEACVYRRLPPGTVLDAFGLAALVGDEHRVDVSSLPAMRKGEEIPLRTLSARSPGVFVLRGDDLRWRPAIGMSDPQNRSVTLVDATGCEMPAVLERQHPSDDSEVRYLVSGMGTPPAFARVTSPDGHDSALGIVTRIDELREQVREVGSRRTEKLRERLELGTDTEATLELLEIIDELEAGDRDRPALGHGVSIPKTRSEDENPVPATAYRKMSYEEFMAHRRPYRDGSRPSASVAGIDMSLVRGVLNRIVGVDAGASGLIAEADSDAIVAAAFDMGDESAVQGSEGDETESGRAPNRADRASRSRKAATAQQIANAVAAFGSAVRGKRQQGDLSATDLLRLRALLMVVCWAGLPSSSDTGPQSDLQVLEMDGSEPTWWRTVGRLINAFFPGTSTALKLSLADDHDQVPPDVLECWATCYWCLQACLSMPVRDRTRQQIRQHIGKLAERVYRLTKLAADELLDGVVRETMDRMSDRLVERLGVAREMIATGHEDLAARLGQG